MKYLFVLSCILPILTSCGTLAKKDFYYNEILLKNSSSLNVEEVTIKVEKTNAIFRCGFIPPGASCANGFPKKKFLGNAITVSWIYGGVKRKTDSFILEVPKEFNITVPMQGVLEVNGSGSVRAYLRQQ